MSGLRAGLAATVLLGLLLSGCMGGGARADIKVTLYDNERYDAQISITGQNDALVLAGVSVSELERELDRMVAETRDDVTSAEWRRMDLESPGLFGYQVTVSGSQADLTDEGFFQITSGQYGGRECLRVVAPDGVWGNRGSQGSLTLHAQEILETNGTLQGKDTVVWYNFTGGSAIVVPKSTGIQFRLESLVGQLLTVAIGVRGVATVLAAAALAYMHQQGTIHIRFTRSG